MNYLLLERNSSLLTLKSYSGDLKEFQLFFKTIEKSLTWEVIDSDLVRDWIESMMDKGMKATSVNRKLSALRTFYRYALKIKLVQNDPTYGIQGPKREKPLPQFLKESEVNELLDSKEWTDDYNGVLARIIILTFYTTGVRLAELVGLDDSDVDFDLRELKVTGKRNKQRIIPFGDELYMALKAYMRKRDEEIDKKSAAIFLSEKGKRVARSQIYAMVRQSLSSVSTLQKRSPHVLRHTFATAMLNHDAGLESVKKLLGHERLTTTEIYTHTTFEQLKEVYKHAHPRA